MALGEEFLFLVTTIFFTEDISDHKEEENQRVPIVTHAVAETAFSTCVSG